MFIKRTVIAGALFATVFFTSCSTNIGRTYKTPDLESYDHTDKFLVGVLPPENKSGDLTADNYRDGLTGVFISELQTLGRYRVIEKERLESLFEEAEFNLSGAVDMETSKKIGKILGVDALCFVNISSIKNEAARTSMGIAWIDKLSSEVVMDGRIVDVETGEVLATASVSETKGKRQWIAFGFLKWGAKPDQALILQNTLLDTSKALAYQLSDAAPHK